MTGSKQLRRATWRRLVAPCAVAFAALVGCSAPPKLVAFVPDTELVPVLGEPGDVEFGGWVPEVNSDCEVHDFKYVAASVNDQSSGWKVVAQHVRSDSDWSVRDVAFSTIRFADRDEFDEQWAMLQEWFSEPCQFSASLTNFDFEPTVVEGLPAESITANWPKRRWPYSTVAMSTIIADRDRQLMMFVVWMEGPQELPTDDYVDVVNTAWSEFAASN